MVEKIRVSDLALAYAGWRELPVKPAKYVPNLENKGVIVHAKMKERLMMLDVRVYHLMHELEFVNRLTGSLEIRGAVDGMMVNEDEVTLLEFKTTKYEISQDGKATDISKTTEMAAVFQLQTYMWIMEPLLKERGMKLNSTGFVVVLDENGKRLREIVVHKRDDIESVIWAMVARRDGVKAELI